MEWSDLRVFLAIARVGSLGAAARTLGQSQPTMGRRLRALEDALGVTLFQRTGDGFVLTDEGASVLVHAERMEGEAIALQRELVGQADGQGGALRISSSDWFGTHMLAPVLAEYARLQPGVVVELLTDARLYDLARREADLVFRMLPFEEPDVIARKLLHIEYGVYAAPGAPHTRLVTMNTAFAGMEDVRWLQRMRPAAQVAARSNSREVQAQLCARGVGLAVLPRPLGDQIAGLALVDLGEPPPGRDTWVGYHRDLKQLPRLRALLELAIERLS